MFYYLIKNNQYVKIQEEQVRSGFAMINCKELAAETSTILIVIVNHAIIKTAHLSDWVIIYLVFSFIYKLLKFLKYIYILSHIFKLMSKKYFILRK